MKKILSLCLVAVLALAAVGGTLAYFTDTEEATNTFTIGNVQISLDEPNWDADNAKADPGKRIAKDPIVTNEGANPAWIRVDVTLSEATAFAAAANAHGITKLDSIFAIASDFDSKWTLAGAPVADAAADTLTYSYYYNSVLAPEENTGALFTAVTVPADFTSEEMAAIGDDFTIVVVANAIQSEGFDTVAEAFAAYDEQMN